MKANEAPEKIYIQSFNVNEEDAKSERLLYFDDVWTEKPEPGEENIEYTRTDAFIEKAARWLNRRLFDRVEVVNFGTTLESITLKEEFVDEFRKYMKGEWNG